MISMSKEKLKIKLKQNEIEAVVGNYLAHLHKGYHWSIDCNLPGGILTIKNLDIHGDYGFVIFLSELVNDPKLDVVMRAAGELLERCNLPRTHRPEVIEGKRDVRGNLIGDLSNATC